MSDVPDLDGVRNLDTLLSQLPYGAGARSLARRLGVWSSATHADEINVNRRYPGNFSALGDDQLSDLNSAWLSEAGRSTELVGLLEGQRTLVALSVKRAVAAARSRARKRIAEDAGEKPVKVTAAELSDMAENDPGVLDAQTTAGMLDMALASAKAYKEACLATVAGISREISFRQAQMNARMR